VVSKSSSLFLSVVVRDCDLFGSCLRPSKADPPLVIDPDAVLTDPVSAELLKPVSRRHLKVSDHFCCIQDRELSQGDPLEITVKLLDPGPLPDSFGLFVTE